MALTSTQLDHFRRILTARRDELASATVRAEAQVGDLEDLSHQDSGDRAAADVARDDLLNEAGRDSEQLQSIEASLARIQLGTYGTCSECGREIPLSRLNAVPWANLCIRDQEISDQKRHAGGAASGGAPSRVTL
jgi:DnaK suppressor protein